MTPELLAMLGGGVSGFVMKIIAAQAGVSTGYTVTEADILAFPTYS